MRIRKPDGMTIFSAIQSLVNSGHFDEATELADALVISAKAGGTSLGLVEAYQQRALVYFARGRTTRAMADAQSAIEGARDAHEVGDPLVHGILAWCLVNRGAHDLAALVLHEVSRWSDADRTGPVAPDQESLMAWYHLPRGCLLLASGDPAAALDEFKSAGRLGDGPSRSSMLLLPWRLLSAIAECELGNRESALRLVNTELTAACELGFPGPIGRALRVLVSVDPEIDAPTYLRAAVALLRTSGMELELASARLDMGRALVAVDDLTGARDQLRLARDLAHRCDVAPLEEAIRTQLAAIGARPRRPAATGREALTQAELRIAMLAADGVSNRVIAESVFLSKDTVDWHLRNVYRKLGVHSRTRLAEVLSDLAASYSRVPSDDERAALHSGGPPGSTDFPRRGDRI